MTNRQLSRRSFLAASTALAAPYFVPFRAFGANDRIVTAHIGVGGQGTSNLSSFLGNGASPAAICDVDSDRLAKAVKLVSDKGHACEGYRDYRKLLERKDIDAVVISTPDQLARPARDPRLPGGEGCLLRKAIVADGGRRATSGRRGPHPQTHRSDRFAAAIGSPFSTGLGAGPFRPNRPD